MELYYKTACALPMFQLEYYAYDVGSYHYNWHQDVELLIVLKGSLDVCRNGTTYSLQEDDVIWINPGEGHTTFAHNAGAVAFVIHFSMDMLTATLQTPKHLAVDFVSSGNLNHVSACFRCVAGNLIQAIDMEPPGRDLFIIATLYQALHRLTAESSLLVHQPRQKFRSRTEDPVKKIVRYIDKNYMRDIRLEDLGALGGYNASYVSQLFRKHLGITFYEYLTRIRLRQSLIDLRDSDLSMLEVATRNGFADVRAFNRYFKSSFARTPLSYRNSISVQHKEVDRVFKKSFVDRNDPLILRKTKAYLQTQACHDIERTHADTSAQQRLAALESFAARIKENVDSLDFQ